MITKTRYLKYIRWICTVVLFAISVQNTYSQGPNAPEAASFEPLDVTDVVNLVTGDFTYTIPVIEVPGPNGGYPLTLSYHSGIAMDQEASWVGLGWSLNAGAINRNVNGFPDDWNNVKTYEYYWNKGETLEQHTLDITLPLDPSFSTSLGLGASWGSLRGFSGTVSLGVGLKGVYGADISVSTNGDSSVGLNIVSDKLSKHASLGLNFGIQGGEIYGNVGIKNTINDSKLDFGFNGGDFSASVKSNGLGISTNGAITFNVMGLSLSTTGSGFSISSGSGASYFNTTQQQDDITIKKSGFNIPLVVVNYRYEKVKWYVDKLKEPGIYGSIFSDHNILNLSNDPDHAFTDISEINYNGDTERFSILNRNPVLLNYDGYNVSGQGVAGQMSPKLMKNISLVNINHDFDEADLSYYKPNNTTAQIAAKFYFDNELSGGAIVNKVTFSNVSNPSGFDNYINNPSTAVTGEKRSGNFVEYFTFQNLPPDIILPENFVKPTYIKNNSIAGFRITSSDGITYTYMLPVYNMMEKSRNFNYQNTERDVYSEKTNEGYATHWLLTSITGPDYVDINTNGKLDEGDYGYWVDFEYGKWSEGMVWRTPGKGDEYSKIQGSRRYSWGIKELYYLDKINTRTHSALFVKELREDAKGVPQQFIYKNAAYDYTMPSQKQLKLNKIVLIQNDKLAPIDKTNAINIASGPNQFHSFTDPKINKTYSFSLNLQDNVLDTKDAFTLNLEQDALRVISFNYDYSLAQNSPNSDAGGKLTLKKVLFKGKQGIALMPPYRFNYSNNPNWEHNNENYWGYNHHDATAWSIDEIISPQGAKIGIAYEGDMYDNNPSQVNANYQFRDVDVKLLSNNTINISADIGNYDLKAGDEIFLDYDSRFSDCDNLRDVRVRYTGKVALVEKNQNTHNFRTTFNFTLLEPQKYTFEVLNTHTNIDACNQAGFSIGAPSFSNINGTPFKNKNHAGTRVASISVSDDINTWKTTYEYGSGSVPYEPYYNFQGVANQSLLRSPNVLYDKVIVRNLDINNEVNDEVKTVYEFITDRTIEAGINQKLSFNATSVPGSFNSFNNNDTRDITYEYKDYQGIIGNLKQTSVYRGNTLLTRNVNNYTFLDESSGFVNTQSTQMYKSVNPKPGNTDYLNINHLISTSYTSYPVVLESSEAIQGGVKKITYFDKHDINSGELLETRFFGSDGSEYRTEKIPAYTIDAYTAMGSKENNSNNKHMLTQEAMTKTYIKNGSVWTPIKASITTWRPWSNDIWRIHKNYIWDGETDSEGRFSNFSGTYDNFNWTLNQTQSLNSEWKQISEVTMYDNYSLPLETLDINNNKATTKTGDNETKVYATGNAGFNELFFSGAEDLNENNFGGGVRKGTATLNSSYFHTGKHSLQISSGNTGYEVTVTEGKSNKYKVSLWVRNQGHTSTRLEVGNTTINYTPQETVRAGNWVQLNFHFILNNTQTVKVVSNSGTIYVDDFRLCPESSSMISYVYNEWDEVSYILGANNMATYFEYDNMGRLIRTHTEVTDFNGPGSGGIKRISENEYNYKY
ncbi:hypothetical protein GTQ40_17785 [Flavobacteriaceae bacterium R38]|nr:hypothetical protein [Flavobacteriaceae bacterium R38]